MIIISFIMSKVISAVASTLVVSNTPLSVYTTKQGNMHHPPTPPPVSKLLPELLHHTFQFLLPDDTHWTTGWSKVHGLASPDFLSLALVCRAWHAIATRFVWRSVLINKQPQLDAVLKLLAADPLETTFPHGLYVREAHLEVGPDTEGGGQGEDVMRITPEVVRVLVTSCPNLEELTLISHGGGEARRDPLGLDEITPARCRRLRRLKVWNYVVTRQPDAGADAGSVTTMGSIRELEEGDDGSGDGSDTTLITAPPAQATTITTVEDEWTRFAANPPHLLTHIHLYHISGVPLPAFTLLLHTAGSRLRYVSIYHCDGIPRSFWEEHLPQRCPNLEGVGAYCSGHRHPPVFSTDDATLETIVEHYPSLSYLAFSPRLVTESGLRSVARLRGLRFLILRGYYRTFPVEAWREVIKSTAGTLTYLEASAMEVGTVREFWERCPMLFQVKVRRLFPRAGARDDPWFSMEGIASCVTFSEEGRSCGLTLRRG